METPPKTTAADGSPRHVGVEIEFGGLPCVRTAPLVAELFGGHVEPVDPHKAIVRDTRYGDFTVELDLALAHADEAQRSGRNAFAVRLEDDLREAAGDVGGLWLPCEIVTPPLPLDQLDAADRILEALRSRGAKGTEEGLLSAFGLHINPEAPETTAESILAHLRAYLLLSDWLRHEIGVDLKRRITPFIDPFPRRWALGIMDPGYRPDLGTLIDDYLSDNPTRNRELDLLPLLSHLDPERVAARIKDPRIKARPAYHYRLPDCSLAPTGGTTVAGEWARWVAVERLAANPQLLNEGMNGYLDHHALPRMFDDWAQRVKGWLVP